MFKFLLLKTRTPFIASSISNVRLMHDRKLPSIKDYKWVKKEKNKVVAEVLTIYRNALMGAYDTFDTLYPPEPTASFDAIDPI